MSPPGKVAPTARACGFGLAQRPKRLSGLSDAAANGAPYPQDKEVKEDSSSAGMSKSSRASNVDDVWLLPPSVHDFVPAAIWRTRSVSS
jgi:hypothetical protein